MEQIGTKKGTTELFGREGTLMSSKDNKSNECTWPDKKPYIGFLMFRTHVTSVVKQNFIEIFKSLDFTCINVTNVPIITLTSSSKVRKLKLQL